MIELVICENTVSKYQLTHPFQRTSVREIGEWTLRGQSVAQKRVIHLTSGVADISGGICCRIPTNTKEFDATISLSLLQDTFVFSFSRNLCPDVSSFFNGMNISFVPFDKDKLKVSLIGAEMFPNMEKIINNIDFSSRMNIMLKKTSGNISIFIKEYSDEPIIANRLTKLYDYGYFSMFSFSPQNCERCITNLYEFTYFPRSTSVDLKPNISENNRKFLKSSTDSRQLMKMQRRAKMEAVSRYIEQSFTLNDTLKNDNVRASDALREVREAIGRMESRISADDLRMLLEKKVKPVLAKASSRFEKVAQALFHSKSDMTSLWTKTVSDLRTLRSDIAAECWNIQNEADAAMMKLKATQKEVAIDTAPPKSKFGILGSICIVEFLFYIIFFIKQHMRMTSKKGH